jgi:gamma-glutamyltranspeptidase/glutathione hydrolase
MAPPSSGGTHIIQILNILEGYPIAQTGFASKETVHYMAEAMRYAYADRSEFMGDPDFVKVPVETLISKEYAAEIRKHIDPDKAISSKDVKPGQHLLRDGNNTTHFSIVDKMGNAVAITYTINDYYGSCASVDGAGFLLNDEMDDFSAKAGVPNIYGLICGDANAIAPGKRPLSSMSPSIVLKDGKLFLVVGSPGGARIITTTLQVIMNVIDHNMTIREAVDAPRVHMQWVPDELRIEKDGLSPDTIALLTKAGYNVIVRPYMGDVNAIMYDAQNKVMYGSGDPRTEF